MLKIGVLGAGHLGKIHIRLLKEISSFQLVGFYDIDADTRKKVSDEFGVEAFDDMDALIDRCDAVDIVTPTLSHFDCAVKALKKSKHVFIEKPLANSVDEARTMISLATEASVKVQVGHVERFNPAFIASRSYIGAPMFIETHRLAQFNPRGTDVSVVLDLMIHDIDIILSIVKSPIKKISTSGVAVVSDTPDIANARIEFANGCVANLTASRISLKNMRKSRFFQRDAYIAVDFLKKSAEVIRLKSVEGEPDPLSVLIELGPDKGTKQIYFENPKVEESNAIKSELEAFAKSIMQNTTPIVDIMDGFHALDVAHQIVEKLKQSAPQMV
ncbi:MAG: Inositol 2-dehydrogenase/D-chiro-inositol 3-dehydrogenase [Bacteroidetes bacterium ADurb.Bin397]|jgi:predicted dehydrogenase|nr:Gfo/Idh/MocA family oxidoreductase [Bacteroidia bacterium]OQA10645.1 MAG: Inositol 2-dehydrogenase/D-chiro-inositol 3-dehydrogenase [Bacteroidetes bacterium ADurb.Bin397]